MIEVPTMLIPDDLREYREPLSTMIRELRANQAILDGLVNAYGVFLFTGGVVAREQWSLVAISSYLDRPFAAGRISTAAAAHYRELAEAIMELGQAIAAGARPRTLRCRHDFADRFDRASSEIRALGSTLESAMMKLVEEMKPSVVPSATEPVESGFSTAGVCAETRGGDQ
jgi:hypothetical protein